MDVPVIFSDKLQQSFVESVEVPQLPFIDIVAGFVASQRQGSQCKLCRRTGCSQVQFLDWDTPVVVQRQGQLVQTLQSGGARRRSSCQTHPSECRLQNNSNTPTTTHQQHNNNNKQLTTNNKQQTTNTQTTTTQANTHKTNTHNNTTNNNKAYDPCTRFLSV